MEKLVEEADEFDEAPRSSQSDGEGPNDQIRLQRLQRRVLYAVFATVLVSGAAIRGLQAGWLSSFAGPQETILTAVFALLAFAAGFGIARFVRTAFSALSTILFAATVGLLIGFLVAPLPCAFTGGVAGIWVAIHKERSLPRLFAFLAFSLIGIAGGAALRFGWVLGPMGVAIATPLLIAVCWYQYLKLACESDDYRRGGTKRSLRGYAFLSVLLFTFLGWHTEKFLFDSLHSFAGYASLRGAQPSWLWKGIPVTNLGLHSPTWLQLKHVAAHSDLMGMSISGLDASDDLSALGTHEKVSWLSLSDVNAKQMEQLGQNFPNVTLLDVQELAQESDFALQEFRMVGQLYFYRVKVDQKFWDQIDNLPLLARIVFRECEIESSQIRPEVQARLAVALVQGGNIESKMMKQIAQLPRLVQLELSSESPPDAQVLETILASKSLSSVNMTFDKLDQSLLPGIAKLSLAQPGLDYTCRCKPEECQCSEMLQAYLTSSSEQAATIGSPP